MKKNLITVIILALVVVNLVLTAVLTISIVPETKKANELITKVCSAIDLDLQAGDTAGSLAINVEDMYDYAVNGGETMTINLKNSGDGKDHYGILGISLSLDNSNPYSIFSNIFASFFISDSLSRDIIAINAFKCISTFSSLFFVLLYIDKNLFLLSNISFSL